VSEGNRDELLESAASEMERLREIVATLEAALGRATAERDLVADWGPERMSAARSALRQPRFADVEGLRAELGRAREELAALEDLRRRLRG
jgi:hypothetical protein